MPVTSKVTHKYVNSLVKNSFWRNLLTHTLALGTFTSGIMSSPRNSGNYKNVRRNAREQRLQFMQNQADLIAQKKREIEEKLAHQHKETTAIVKEEPKELAKCSEGNML